MKKIMSIILAAVFSLGFTYVNSSKVDTQAREKSVSLEVLDEYLQKSGYSENFIENTQEEEKRRIYKFGAVFESETKYSLDKFGKVSVNDSPIDDTATFSASLTCSHISYENNTTKKMLTYHWSINSALSNSYQDIVELAWYKDKFRQDSDSAYFLYTVQGYLTSSYRPHVSVEIPAVATQTIICEKGKNAISTDVDGLSITTTYQLSKPDYQFRKYYSSGSYGNYKISGHRGTYSVIISGVNQYSYGDPTSTAVGRYYHQNVDFNPVYIKYKSSGFLVVGGGEVTNSYKMMDDVAVMFYYKHER